MVVEVLAVSLNTVPRFAAGRLRLEVKKEMAKLQGAWRLVSFEAREVSLAEENLKDSRLIIKGNTFLCTDGKQHFEGTYKIVEVMGKVRKTDATYRKADGALTGKTVPQLAEWIDDDSFRTCLPSFMGELKRPAKFVTTGDEAILIFRREKK
jgi:uncharacterized protein (TIGR03067 family)